MSLQLEPNEYFVELRTKAGITNKTSRTLYVRMSKDPFHELPSFEVWENPPDEKLEDLPAAKSYTP